MTLINLETCPYPYYHLATSKEEIKEDFRKLTKHEFKTTIRYGKSSFFNVDLTDYQENADFLRITDYFSEEVRVKCQFADCVTPYDWFQKNREKIIKKFGKSEERNDVRQKLIHRGANGCSGTSSGLTGHTEDRTG